MFQPDRPNQGNWRRRWARLTLGMLAAGAWGAGEPAQACSELLLSGSGTAAPVVSARTMDLESNTWSRFIVVPRGLEFQSLTPDFPYLWGMKWTVAYGFIGLDTNENFISGPMTRAFIRHRYSDGMNEKGLSACVLWLDGSTFLYEGTVAAKSLCIVDAVGWILGKCATVDDVVKAFKKTDPDLQVWMIKAKPFGIDMSTPLHVAVHDAQGKSLIIEWLDKSHQPRLWYDDGSWQKGVDAPGEKYAGVLTNDPNYSRQLALLFRGTAPAYTNEDPWVVAGPLFGYYDEGAGLQELPGDHTPISRFERLYQFNRFATPLPPAGSGIDSNDWRVAQAFRLIGQVNGPVGECHHVSTEEQYGPDFFTVWTLVRDHGRRHLYYTGTRNQSAEVIKLDDYQGYFKDGKDKGLWALGTPEGWKNEQASLDNDEVGGLTAGAVAAAGDGKFDLTVTVPVPAELKGQRGEMYIIAERPAGSNQFWSWSRARRWTLVTAGSAPKPCFTGRLADKAFQVLKGAAPADWQATGITAGCGRSFAEMMIAGRCPAVFPAPDFSAAVAGTP